MAYDFETLLDRTNAGSVKWDNMREADPGVPKGIVPLSVADMEFRTPPELLDGLRDYLETNVLGYTSPTRDDLRAVVDWMRRRHGWEIEPDWLVNFDGVVPALYAAVTTFTAPGEGVVYMPPVYPPMRFAIADTGRNPVPVPLLEEDGVYSMDYAALEAAVARPDVRMVLFCSPHNPVSRVWRRDELERFGRICLAHDVLVVSDEIHMDFVMPGHRHLVYSEAAPEFADHAIVCTAPSKTFNIAGLQASNIVIPNADIRELFRESRENSGRFDANQLGLAACRIAYDRCEGWLDALLKLVKKNADVVRAFMAAHFPEVGISDFEGTYLLWLDFRRWGLDAGALEEFMVRKARLFLDEGPIFGEEGRGFERVNLACPTRVLEEALERLLAARRG